MNKKRKQRLVLVSLFTVGIAIVVGLTMYALSENINLFYNPTQIANGEAPVGAKIRAGGMVREGSVSRSEESLAVQFVLTDFEADVAVEYTGILPDLFREGQGIVALGRMNEDKVFVAEEVLAKHDENYMPPEVAEALEKSGHGVKASSEYGAYGSEKYGSEKYGSEKYGSEKYGSEKHDSEQYGAEKYGEKKYEGTYE